MLPTLHDPAANRLLGALPPADLARWLPHLAPVNLRVGEMLHEAGRAPAYAYFPITAVLSLLMPMRDGRCDEVCVVGHEGMVGLSLSVDAGAATRRAVVQVAGSALRVPAAWLQQEFEDSPFVMHLLLRYTMARGAELAQSIVCSRHHSTAQRLCRRLLQGMDRQEGSDLMTTQEQLAGLLGVRRESITEEALKLQRAGAIRYSRGRITVVDRDRLEQLSCECHALVSRVQQRLASDPLHVPVSRASPVADLATHLQKIRDQERGDLARELHDELGSLLTRARLDLASLKMRLKGASPEVDQLIQHLGEMISQGIAFSRRVVEGLHPSSLTNLGLAASLEILAREFQKATGVDTQLCVDDVKSEEETQLAIYRVVQESLNNISKYAAARQVGISMVDCGSDVVVAVRDDGRGFDPGAAGSASHGVAGMRHRVHACAGEFTVSSGAATGTLVVAVLPARRGSAAALRLQPPALGTPRPAFQSASCTAG